MAQRSIRQATSISPVLFLLLPKTPSIDQPGRIQDRFDRNR
jgi:hypothetical protein